MSELKTYKIRGEICQAKVAESDGYINTAQGAQQFSKGDYLIIGKQGTKYVRRKNVFESMVKEIEIEDGEIVEKAKEELVENIVDKSE